MEEKRREDRSREEKKIERERKREREEKKIKEEGKRKKREEEEKGKESERGQAIVKSKRARDDIERKAERNGFRKRMNYFSAVLINIFWQLPTIFSFKFCYNVSISSSKYHRYKSFIMLLLQVHRLICNFNFVDK